MKLIINGTEYPLHGYTDPAEYTIIGQLTAMYYLCKDKDGNEFALYLPNLNEYYPRVN